MGRLTRAAALTAVASVSIGGGAYALASSTAEPTITVCVNHGSGARYLG